jgi:hypothetical protein
MGGVGEIAAAVALKRRQEARGAPPYHQNRAAGHTRSAAAVAQKRQEHGLGLPLRHFSPLHGGTPPERRHFMLLTSPFAQGAFTNIGIPTGRDRIIFIGFENLVNQRFVIGRVASGYAIVSLKQCRVKDITKTMNGNFLPHVELARVFAPARWAIRLNQYLID